MIVKLSVVLFKVKLDNAKRGIPSQGGKVDLDLWSRDPKSKGILRATDKARKSVITHWKLLKTHWKNKQGVKIHISISRYALGVQSSAYWFAKLKVWIDDVHLSVRLSTYCQSFPLHYNEWYNKNKCLQYNTTSNSKILQNLCLKWHKTTDMRFKTVLPSLLRIAKKYRGCKYNFTFWKSALSKKLGGKYALD